MRVTHAVASRASWSERPKTGDVRLHVGTGLKGMGLDVQGNTLVLSGRPYVHQGQLETELELTIEGVGGPPVTIEIAYMEGMPLSLDGVASDIVREINRATPYAAVARTRPDGSIAVEVSLKPQGLRRAFLNRRVF